MNTLWLNRIKNADKTCLLQDGKKKIHYKFENGEEMVEEYNIETGVVMKRAWKKDHGLKKSGTWDVEVGDPEPSQDVGNNIGFSEQANSPYIVKRITKNSLEWRIRNLAYPLPNYYVTVDKENTTIIVKTENKKYYKVIKVPDLERANLVPDEKNLKISHQFNTLIITYKKPAELIELEKKIIKEIESAKAIDDGDLPCKPS